MKFIRNLIFIWLSIISYIKSIQTKNFEANHLESSNNSKLVLKTYGVLRGNSPLNEGKMIKFKIDFNNDGEILFHTKKETKNVHLNELLYFDEKVIFTIKDLDEIVSPIYKEFVYNSYVPLIKEIAGKDETISKYGLVMFHNRQELENGIITRKDTAIIVGPTDDKVNEGTAQTSMEEFKVKLTKSYQEAISSWVKIQWNLPDLMEKIDPNVYYWNSMQNMQRLEEYFASIGLEGIILNSSNRTSLATVKNAYRYDQLIECQGIRDSLDLAPASVKNNLPQENCCVGYNINWNGKVEKELFCSISKNVDACIPEINLFRKFVFKKCVEKGIFEIGKLLEEGKQLDDPSLNLNTKIHYMFIMDVMKKYNIFKSIEKSHKFYKYFKTLDEKKDVIDKQISKGLDGVDTYKQLGNKEKENGNGNESGNVNSRTITSTNLSISTKSVTTTTTDSKTKKANNIPSQESNIMSNSQLKENYSTGNSVYNSAIKSSTSTTTNTSSSINTLNSISDNPAILIDDRSVAKVEDNGVTHKTYQDKSYQIIKSKYEDKPCNKTQVLPLRKNSTLIPVKPSIVVPKPSGSVVEPTPTQSQVRPVLPVSDEPSEFLNDQDDLILNNNFTNCDCIKHQIPQSISNKNKTISNISYNI
jgi:hypothetical protein